MKILSCMFGLLLAFNATTLNAQSCVEDTCCPELSYSVYVDYLYWKVSRSDIFYSDFFEETDEYLCPKHTSNYRIGATVQYDCVELGLRYTSMKMSDSSNLLKYDMDFDMLDLQVGYPITFDCIDATFVPFAGVKFIWSDQKLYDREDELTLFKDTFDAVGIYTGIDSKWQLFNQDLCSRCIPVSLVIRGSTGILEGTNNYNLGLGKECLFTFANELFMGVNASVSDCGCADLDVQLGYEIQQYTNWAQFFGFSGLVLRVGASF